MNRFKSLIGKSVPIIPNTPNTLSVTAEEPAAQAGYPKKYDKYAKDGPELLITRILMVHGPLQNK
jgi:hypothetical protein